MNKSLDLSSNKSEENNKEYLYIINYPSFEEELCRMEMKHIFGIIPKRKYFFSNNYIAPSRSPFIKQCLSVIYSGDSVEEIVRKIKENNLSYENFKVCYIKIGQEDVNYAEQLAILRDIGFVINGFADIHNPEVLLGISKVEDKWIFGVYEKNDYLWHAHDKKPYSYSNGLGLRMAKAIVNIAVGNELNRTVIDPCCGVGTVVIEGLDLGVEIKGYEINPSIGQNAKENLGFFGYKDVITIGDMHSIKDSYDVAIVDIPYGLFSPTTVEEQRNIIETSRRIAKKMIIITFEDMDNHINAAGFHILDKCSVSKGSFRRYIIVCE